RRREHGEYKGKQQAAVAAPGAEEACVPWHPHRHRHRHRRPGRLRPTGGTGAVMPIDRYTLVRVSTPISAGTTHCVGTYSSPPPTGMGAVGTSTARCG